MKLIFATNNRHKFEEIRSVLDPRFELLNLNDIGHSGEIPEDHETLEENAAQKAFFIYEKVNINCFADDTGLMIDALQGEPGVYSARYAGKDCTFEDNMNKVLGRMKSVRNRQAYFRTVIALVEEGHLKIFQGEIQGLITHEKRGQSGFGYDPIFQPNGFDRTFAEMTLSEKNGISHRALAVKKLTDYLSMHHQ
jgi:XTP/dITP diphosphohydrolase